MPRAEAERWDDLGRRLRAASSDLFDAVYNWVENITDMGERAACPLEVRSELGRALRGSRNESSLAPAAAPVAVVAVKRGRRKASHG